MDFFPSVLLMNLCMIFAFWKIRDRGLEPGLRFPISFYILTNRNELYIKDNICSCCQNLYWILYPYYILLILHLHIIYYIYFKCKFLKNLRRSKRSQTPLLKFRLHIGAATEDLQFGQRDGNRPRTGRCRKSKMRHLWQHKLLILEV